jgi:ribosomal protein L5
MESIIEKQKSVYEAMKSDFSYTNVMQAPKLVKVIISTVLVKHELINVKLK